MSALLTGKKQPQADRGWKFGLGESMDSEVRRGCRWLGALGFALAIALAQPAGAQGIKPVLDAGKERTRSGQASQKRVDKLAEERRVLAATYRAVLKEIEGLEVYNAQLSRQIDAQKAEIVELDTSIDGATEFDRQILPLMLRMIGGLEQFVKLDVPFLSEERTERLEFLKSLVDRADVTPAEKFRRVLEAYQIEGEYGRTIEAYRTSLDVAGASREVDMLRIGRISLFFQTLDAEYHGVWDQKGRSWSELGAGYAKPIRQGLQMARKQVAPDLLTLPVAAPDRVSK